MTASGPRIAVCTASVGHGHTKAAQALAEALRIARPDAIVDIVDALALAPAWFRLCYRDAYLATVTRVPPLAGWLYRMSDRPSTGPGAGVPERIGMRRFSADDRVINADAIVTTHFLCGRVLSSLKAAGRLRAPLTICVTDQHPHGVWLARHADRLLVAGEGARVAAIAAGIPAERIIVTGIPIDNRFTALPDRHPARDALNLPQDRPIALISGGGLGLGGMESTVRALMDAGGKSPVHVVAVCGHNAACRATLQPFAREPDPASPYAPSCSVLGFTDQMPALMAAADLLIGKPGGLTTAEAAAAGLPMVLIRPIPGQEERNADRLVGEGAAVLERDPAKAGRVAALLLADAPRHAAMRARSTSLGRPNAATAGAAEVLRLLEIRRPVGEGVRAPSRRSGEPAVAVG